MTSPWANPPELPPEPVREPNLLVHVNTLDFDRLIAHLNASIDHAQTHMPKPFADLIEQGRSLMTSRFRPSPDVPLGESHLYSRDYPIEPLKTPLASAFPGLDDRHQFCPGSLHIAQSMLAGCGIDIEWEYGDEKANG